MAYQRKVDTLLVDFYWAVRVLSVLDLTHTDLEAVFKDAYMGLCNLETFFKYEANGFFSSQLDANLWVRKYITPLCYVLKIVKGLNLDTMPVKTIGSFLKLYSQNLVSLDTMRVLCEKGGLKTPDSFNYFCSRKWFTYPGSIKKLGRGLLLKDWRFQNESVSDRG